MNGILIIDKPGGMTSHDVVSIVPVDLLGNGTACLVWSSPFVLTVCLTPREEDRRAGR